jgi:hypothetical protein
MITEGSINIPYTKEFTLDLRAYVFVETILMSLKDKEITVFFKERIECSNYKIARGKLDFDEDCYIFTIENKLIVPELVLYVLDNRNRNVFSIFLNQYTPLTNVHISTLRDTKGIRLLKSIRNKL